MKKPHTKPYQALHARIYLCGETDSSIGEKVGLSQQQMSARMKGKCPFDTREMFLIGRERNFKSKEYYKFFIEPLNTLEGFSQ